MALGRAARKIRGQLGDDLTRGLDPPDSIDGFARVERHRDHVTSSLSRWRQRHEPRELLVTNHSHHGPIELLSGLHGRTQDAVRCVRPANLEALGKDRVLPRGGNEHLDVERVGVRLLSGNEPGTHPNGRCAGRKQFGDPLNSADPARRDNWDVNHSERLGEDIVQALRPANMTTRLDLAIDRIGPERTLALHYAVGAVFIAAFALVALPYAMLLLMSFLAGATIIGSQTGANGTCGKLYPARMRTSGLGWALGIGRLGGIAAPVLGGYLLALGLAPTRIFLSACFFALIAAVATALLALRGSRAEPVGIETVAP